MVTVRPFFQPINCSGKAWNVIALLITQESVEPSNFGFNVPQMDRLFFAKGTKRGPTWTQSVRKYRPTHEIPRFLPLFRCWELAIMMGLDSSVVTRRSQKWVDNKTTTFAGRKKLEISLFDQPLLLLLLSNHCNFSIIVISRNIQA